MIVMVNSYPRVENPGNPGGRGCRLLSDDFKVLVFVQPEMPMIVLDSVNMFYRVSSAFGIGWIYKRDVYVFDK
jgi:hypothetical protein